MRIKEATQLATRAVPLKILKLLADGQARSVTTIYMELDLNQPETSQGLRNLFRAGLIQRTAHGSSRYYQLRPNAQELLEDVKALAMSLANTNEYAG